PLDPLQKDNLPLAQKKFDPRYKDHYTGTEFMYYYMQWSEKSIWDGYMEFLRDHFSFNTNHSLESIDFVIQILKISAYIIIVVLIAFLVRYIILNDIHLIFRKKPKELVEVYDLDKDIHEIDFDQLIEDAVSREQYRSAVRYHFLRLLKIMSEKQIIEWNPDKTNREYLLEISNPALKKEFDYLAYVYENIWYG